MSPITSTLANGSAYGYRAFAAAAAGAYESIATATGNGSSGTITFSSIPSTYTSLQIRFMTFHSAVGQTNITFNGVGGTSYARHCLVGDGSSSPYTNAEFNQAAGQVAGNAFGGSTTFPNVGIIDIDDYTSTTKNKTVRAISGADTNSSSSEIGLYSSVFMNTSAVTSLSLVRTSGVFNSGTVISLYGIKGA